MARVIAQSQSEQYSVDHGGVRNQYMALASRDRRKQTEVRLSLKVCFMTAVCLYGVSSQALYDAPAATATAFKEHYQMDEFQYSLVYVVYAVPGIILVFLVGAVVDTIGVNVSSCFFCVLMTTGATMMWIGSASRSYVFMLASFSVYGLGAASILTAQYAAFSRWFQGEELALAFGLATAMLRLGATLDFNIDPWLAEEYGLEVMYLFPWGVTVVSMLCCFVAAMIDKIRFGRRSGSGSTAVALPSKDLNMHWPTCGDIIRINPMFWLVGLLCTTISLSDFMFELFAVGIFQMQDDPMDARKAGLAVSFTSVAALVAAPLASLVVGRVGYYGHFMILAGVIEGTGAVLFLLPNPPDYVNFIACVLFGIGYAVGSVVMFTSVSLIVRSSLQGTAFGIVNGMINIGLLVLPYLYGLFYDMSGSWFWSKILLCSCCATTIIAASVLVWMDKKGILKKPKSGGQDPEETGSVDVSFNPWSAALDSNSTSDRSLRTDRSVRVVVFAPGGRSREGSDNGGAPGPKYGAIEERTP